MKIATSLLLLAAVNAQLLGVSVTRVTPVDDATVETGPLFFSSGTSVSIQSTSSGEDGRGWFKFDLSGQLPDNAVISRASLRLWVWRQDFQNDLPISVHGSTNDSWDEATITWATQPAFNGTAEDSTTLLTDAEDEWVELDVTSFVDSEFPADKVISLVVKATSESGPNSLFAVNSKERNDPTYNYRLIPELRVEYTGSWPSTGQVSIIHINDIHSRLTPHDLDVAERNDLPEFERVGGAPHLGARVLESAANYPDALVLDAGDLSEGNPLGDLRANGGVVDFYDLLHAKLQAIPGRPGNRGLDAVVVGNHDVRFFQMLTNFQNADFPVISMNILYDTGNTQGEPVDSPMFDPYVVVETNGTRVGIVGYTTENSQNERGDDVTDVYVAKCEWNLDNLNLMNGDTVNLRHYVDLLRKPQALGGEECDMVLLLMHVGHRRIAVTENINDPDERAPLIKYDPIVRIPEITIAGHWHTITEKVWQPAQFFGQLLLAEAASFAQYSGELHVTPNGKYVSSAKYPIRHSEIVPDPDIQNLVADLIQEYETANPDGPHLFEEVGYSAVDLRLDKDKWWTSNEFPWFGDNTAGHFITDSMVWKANQLVDDLSLDLTPLHPTDHEVKLAFQSGGGIRRDIKKGPLTYIEIYEMYPWPDDNMVIVRITGQDIMDFIESKGLGASISQGWEVEGDDGLIASITYNDVTVNPGDQYNVAISEYMFDNENIRDNTTFQSQTRVFSGASIREGAVEYASQFDEQNPMDVPLPRYTVPGEFSGGFKAGVTMTNVVDEVPFFEAAFVRLLEAMPETMEHLGKEVPTDLVNPDGSINPDHQFSETQLYRSHLGLMDGYLKPGTVIEVWGEGGFFRGTPEFIDQQGIYGLDEEWRVHGHAGDGTYAADINAPTYYCTIGEFWNEQKENHYVAFHAERASNSQLRDSEGFAITAYKEDAFDGYGIFGGDPLPGSNGDFFYVTGVMTQRDTERRFRVHTLTPATTTGFPATATIEQPASFIQNGNSVTLKAIGCDKVTSGGQNLTATIIASDDAFTSSGQPNTMFGLFNGGPNLNWNLDIQGTLAGSFDNQQIWMKFPLASTIPATATINSATLRMYLYESNFSSNLPIQIHGSDNDAWAENTITWNTQPTELPTILDTATLLTSQAEVWLEYDVTSFIAVESSTDQTATLLMRPTTYSAGSAQFTFNSKDFPSDDEGPRLQVDYTTSTTTGGVSSVAFYYRHSVDGQTWGAWTLIGNGTNTTGDEWDLTFDFASDGNGAGYYEFYSIATDTDSNVEPAPLIAEARVRKPGASNTAPGTPVNDGIADGATDVNTSPILAVSATDADFDLLTISFYNGDDDSLLASFSNVPSGQTVYWQWAGLTKGTTHSWYAVADDGTTTTRGPGAPNKWFFTTSGNAPALNPDYDFYTSDLEDIFGSSATANDSPPFPLIAVDNHDGTATFSFPVADLSEYGFFIEYSYDMHTWYRSGLYGPYNTGNTLPGVREMAVDLDIPPTENTVFFQFICDQ